MSADVATLLQPRMAPRFRLWDPAAQRLTRFALGLSLAVVVALGVAWPLSFLTPVLAAAFLAAPKPLPFRAAVGFVGIISVACAAAFALCYTLQYPGVFFPLSVLGLFLLQYSQQRGTSPIVIMWFTIAWLLIPFMGIQSMGVAFMIAESLLFSTTVAIVLVWCAFMVFPAPDAPAAARPASKETASDVKQHLIVALRNTAAIAPAFLAFHLFEWTNHVLVLIFVVLQSGQPAFQKGFKGGSALLAGNLIGGLGAIVVFNLLTVAPSISFLALITMVAAFLFGTIIFAGGERAPLFQTGMSTLLLIIGNATTSTGDAGSLVYVRLMQLLAVVVYLVLAFGMIESLSRREAKR